MAELTWNAGKPVDQHKPVGHSLATFVSLSDESAAEEDEALASEEELSDIPPMPVADVDEAMLYLDSFQQRCKAVCQQMTGAKAETERLQEEIDQEIEMVDKELTATKENLKQLEDEVSVGGGSFSNSVIDVRYKKPGKVLDLISRISSDAISQYVLFLAELANVRLTTEKNTHSAFRFDES